MIFITGDTHADFSRFTNAEFPAQKYLTKEDYVIICGDFGGIWASGDIHKIKEGRILNNLNERKFTILWVDGNHENFDRLYNYPVEEWHGGKVHFIRPSIIHLMRGQVYDIDGYKFFTFGGASSHDIDGGVLDPDSPNFENEYFYARKSHLPFRVNHWSWWKEELPSKEEMDEGLKNLEKHNYKVDYIITHCAPKNIQAILSNGTYKSDYLIDYLTEVAEKTKFKRWYFGHYHDNRRIDDKFTLLYEDMRMLPEPLDD